MANALNWEAAKAAYPSTTFTAEQWRAALNARPEVFWKIMVDLYSLIKDEEDKERGVRRVGRRPRRIPTSTQDLFDTVMPERYTNESFTVMFPKMLGDRSLRSFAAKTGISKSALMRYADGSRVPDLPTMALIARALKVSPNYFPEYRAAAIAEGINALLREQPGVSQRVINDLFRNGPKKAAS